MKDHTRQNRKINLNQKITKSLFALGCFVIGTCLPAHSETVFLKGTAYQTGISLKDIKLGVSEVVVSNSPIKRVAVSDPSIADIRILSETSALVRGKKIGRTTILIWEGKDDNVRPTRFDITVKRDISDLIASLKLLDPNINVDYIVITGTQVTDAPPSDNNSAFTTSYRTQPQLVGEPVPSVVINPNATQRPADTAVAANPQQGDTERIILSGKVKNADVIARALATTASYMGEQNNFKVVNRTGGFVADELNQILSPQGGGGDGGGGVGGAGGGGGSFALDQIQFPSNLRGNLSNGTVIANGSGRIVSFLEIDGRVQIAVKIRFYEISKNRNKTFKAQAGFFPSGVGTFAGGGAAGGPVANQNLQYSNAAPSLLEILNQGALNPGSFFTVLPEARLYLALEALESLNLAKVLAEPTIVVANGELGQFRAGGEVPIQNVVNNGVGGIGQSFNYQPFGIALNIMPSITDADSVLMNVAASTRDPDEANPFTLTGAPAFRTRKTNTQVELDPSQALVIGGLINNASSQSLSKYPLIGDLPILGTLFRSKDFQRGESELIIVLSPEVIRAGNPAQVTGPLALENTIRRSEFDLIPTNIEGIRRRTAIPIEQTPFDSPKVAPVDLTRPATVNDLDNIYR
ncbi:MAG: pilus assembly protein N-terminal domain-containing protein [Candidatus Caenarcaniphilales bacterium]|nr:pilus assembly protein N-terminal domain-containing protein [Candidatus Caenarcaniphilales bacterium]